MIAQEDPGRGIARALDNDKPWRFPSARGTLTVNVRGSRVEVTVSLRRWWTALMNFTPTDAQLRRAAAFALRAMEIANTGVGLLLALTFIFVAAQLVAAFLPGGAAAGLIAHANTGGR
jgi:hypothetical protein